MSIFLGLLTECAKWRFSVCSQVDGDFGISVITAGTKLFALSPGVQSGCFSVLLLCSMGSSLSHPSILILAPPRPWTGHPLLIGLVASFVFQYSALTVPSSVRRPLWADPLQLPCVQFVSCASENAACTWCLF